MKFAITKTQRKANVIARTAGYGTATEIVFGDEDKVVSHTSYGYRKNTTGEYVPNSYRSNFGWKNTYYQHAATVVMLKKSPQGRIQDDLQLFLALVAGKDWTRAKRILDFIGQDLADLEKEEEKKHATTEKT